VDNKPHSMTATEREVMLVLDRLGLGYAWYTSGKLPSDTCCVICGLEHVDFIINRKPFHLECI